MDYVSLKEATKYCKYSQDYLKLRARQGRLKALKIGRNWVTAREWVEEYANGVARLSRATSCSAEPSTAPSKTDVMAKEIFKGVVFSILLAVIVIGVFVNFDIYLEYVGWLEDKFLAIEIDKVIPARIMEIK